MKGDVVLFFRLPVVTKINKGFRSQVCHSGYQEPQKASKTSTDRLLIEPWFRVVGIGLTGFGA